MEWLRNLSDNEWALLGCLGALVVSFGLVGGSYHLGRILRHARGDAAAPKHSVPQSAPPQERPATTRRAA